VKSFIPWVLLIVALAQFISVALPPGNADLICVESAALDLAHHEQRFLYPGAGFSRNAEWMAHHARNLDQIGLHHIEPNWLTYPPLVPLILSPFAMLDAQGWRMTWGVIQFLLVVVFAELIIRLLRRSDAGANVSRILVYALVIGSYPLARSIQLGQTSLLIAVLIWVGYLARMSNRYLPAAFSIGIALFIKPFVGLAEIAPVIHNRRLTSLGSVVVALGLMVVSVILIGISAHIEYWHMLGTWSASQSTFFPNQSLFSGLMRFFVPQLPITEYAFHYDPDRAQIGRVLALVILAAAAYVQWKSEGVHIIASIGLWLSAMMLAVPISWEHYLVFLLPTMAFLWMLRWTPTARVMLAVSTVLLCFDNAPFCTEDFAGRLASSLPILGNLILFGLLILLHVRSRAAVAKPVPA
jgi:hypothetical protein